MLTTFWDLCSDVILEICNYFSVNELFFTFYPDVVPYLFQLLNESHIKLYLCLNNNNSLAGKLLCLINPNQVVSLHLSSGYIPSIFNAVQTLTLKDVYDVNNILSRSSVFPLLQRLNLIYLQHRKHEVENAFRIALLRSSLKYLKLDLNHDHFLTPENSLGQSFSIEQLEVNALCSQSTVQFLFNSLPSLRVLRVRTLMDLAITATRNPFGGPNAVVPPPPMIYHSSIRTIDLVWYHPNMINIVIFLKGLSNLKRCRLSGVMNFKELNGRFWHDLIMKTCSKLSRMTINMLIWTGTETEEIRRNFDQDMFFEDISFILTPSNRENELLILIGDFQRSF